MRFVNPTIMMAGLIMAPSKGGYRYMQILRLIATLIALSVLTTACVAPGPNRPGTTRTDGSSTVTPPPQPVIVSAREQLGKNAPYLLCDQPAYVSCYQTTYDQCVTELSGFSQECIQNADSKFPTLDTRESMQKYSQTVGMCLALKHMNAHGAQIPSLPQCIQNLQFDSAQGQRSLQK